MEDLLRLYLDAGAPIGERRRALRALAEVGGPDLNDIFEQAVASGDETLATIALETLCRRWHLAVKYAHLIIDGMIGEVYGKHGMYADMATGCAGDVLGTVVNVELLGLLLYRLDNADGSYNAPEMGLAYSALAHAGGVSSKDILYDVIHKTNITELQSRPVIQTWRKEFQRLRQS